MSTIETFLLYFLNGVFLEFGDELLCATFEGFGTWAYDSCRPSIIQSLEQGAERYPFISVLGVLIGYAVTPTAFLAVLFVRRPQTATEVFQRIFWLECFEGTVSVFGQLASGAEITYAVLALVYSLFAGLIRGSVFAFMHEWQRSTLFKVQVVALLCVALAATAHFAGVIPGSGQMPTNSVVTVVRSSEETRSPQEAAAKPAPSAPETLARAREIYVPAKHWEKLFWVNGRYSSVLDQLKPIRAAEGIFLKYAGHELTPEEQKVADQEEFEFQTELDRRYISELSSILAYEEKFGDSMYCFHQENPDERPAHENGIYDFQHYCRSAQRSRSHFDEKFRPFVFLDFTEYQLHVSTQNNFRFIYHTKAIDEEVSKIEYQSDTELIAVYEDGSRANLGIDLRKHTDAGRHWFSTPGWVALMRVEGFDAHPSDTEFLSHSESVPYQVK